MKKVTTLFLAASAFIIITLINVSCAKEQVDNNLYETAAINKDTVYSSIADFQIKNGLTSTHVSISATAGGTFTTSQGTIVKIPANAFIDKNGNTVSGIVDIEFKDIYLKSDMLINNKPTVTTWGTPLKSGGEFFIRATSGNVAVNLNGANPIVVVQPTNKLDSAMAPFLGNVNAGVLAWGDSIQGQATLRDSISSYIFSLYQFNSPVDSGSWCNSDNAGYFSAYPQTTLTLHANDIVDSFGTQVYLVFTGINSMVHVYRAYTTSYTQDFPYNYAPVGLSCTVVAIDVKDGHLYSSFTPITISNNLITNFSLSLTTTAAFITQLKTLN